MKSWLHLQAIYMHSVCYKDFVNKKFNNVNKSLRKEKKKQKLRKPLKLLVVRDRRSRG